MQKIHPGHDKPVPVWLIEGTEGLRTATTPRAVMKRLITELAELDGLFDQYAERFGRDQTPYRNHVYRVINLVAAQRTLTGARTGSTSPWACCVSASTGSACARSTGVSPTPASTPCCWASAPGS